MFATIYRVVEVLLVWPVLYIYEINVFFLGNLASHVSHDRQGAALHRKNSSFGNMSGVIDELLT